jgi:hypothetical protein
MVFLLPVPCAKESAAVPDFAEKLPLAKEKMLDMKHDNRLTDVA